MVSKNDGARVHQVQPPSPWWHRPPSRKQVSQRSLLLKGMVTPHRQIHLRRHPHPPRQRRSLRRDHAHPASPVCLDPSSPLELADFPYPAQSLSRCLFRQRPLPSLTTQKRIKRQTQAIKASQMPLLCVFLYIYCHE